VFVNPALEK